MESLSSSDGPANLFSSPKVQNLSTKQQPIKPACSVVPEDRKRPLQILDLPVDVLQAMIREVTHTNDLTSLALTHSAFHDLVIPHIYTRFDIVWPDASSAIETRIGVDALTYGLATLVMAQDVFGEATYQQKSIHKCENCGHQNHTQLPERSRSRKIRRGNYFAQYTRKFSLGNGPVDLVQEYLITKEGGKMLGTLVALAVGRMRNLEAFIWDMPTGVLRDVWLALASLGNRDDGQECRLEKVWVRWHDNREQGPLASPPPPGPPSIPHNINLPMLLTGAGNSLFHIPPYPRVEFPTFSISPPLRSLSVLDIDELPYVEEMSILIERSLQRLRELRIGVAQHAQFDHWVRPAEDRVFVPVPSLFGTELKPRPGGILGILVSRFCGTFAGPVQAASQVKPENTASTSMPDLNNSHNSIESTEAEEPAKNDEPDGDSNDSDINQLGVLLSAQGLQDDLEQDFQQPESNRWVESANQGQIPHSRSTSSLSDPFASAHREDRASKRLRLDILEVERVYLSINVLSRAIDWSCLTTLTLLGCMNHEQLWRALRKRFTPFSRNRNSSSTTKTTGLALGSAFFLSQSSTPKSPAIPVEDYPLKLTRLHTDTVSPALIAFIKDTLAPDTLEWLFLQESSTYKSTVSIETIYRGAIRRHRGSLKKLLIDSELRSDDDGPDSSWRRWIYNRELLTSITSGKMQLRELGMSIDYRDWHFFLQRLPNARHLRSLHIAHIAEHVHGIVDSRESALQVLDIVALRPELELCYLAVQSKCFEVLEYTSNRRIPPSTIIQSGLHEPAPGDSDENEEMTDLHTFENESDLDLASHSHDDETEDESHSSTAKPCFRLREILFYDDKVSIFRARHGRL